MPELVSFERADEVYKRLEHYIVKEDEAPWVNVTLVMRDLIVLAKFEGLTKPTLLTEVSRLFEHVEVVPRPAPWQA